MPEMLMNRPFVTKMQCNNRYLKDSVNSVIPVQFKYIEDLITFTLDKGICSTVSLESILFGEKTKYIVSRRMPERI